MVTVCNSCDGRGRGSLKDLREGWSWCPADFLELPKLTCRDISHDVCVSMVIQAQRLWILVFIWGLGWVVPCKARVAWEWKWKWKNSAWDLRCGPVVKTLPSNVGGASLITAQGAKIPHALWPENLNMKQKQYCNKFNKDFKNGPH